MMVWGSSIIDLLALVELIDHKTHSIRSIRVLFTSGAFWERDLAVALFKMQAVRSFRSHILAAVGGRKHTMVD